MSGFESTNACDGNIAHQGTILSQAQAEGNFSQEAAAKDCIQQKLQSEYQKMADEEMSSDPTRADRLRAKLESEALLTGGTLPKFNITDDGANISVSFAEERNVEPPKQADVQPMTQDAPLIGPQPLPFGPTDVQVPIHLGDPNSKPVDANVLDANAKPSDANAKPADANVKPADANAKSTDSNAKTADRNAKPADASAQPHDKVATANSAMKPADAVSEAPKKVVKHGIAPAPRGERRVAGNDEWTVDAKLIRNDDGTFNYRWKDASEVRWDANQPPRVAQIKNIDGTRTTLRYRGEEKHPSAFIVQDRNGTVTQTGHKTGVNSWELDIRSGDKHDLLKNSKIKEVFMTDDLQLCFKDKAGRTIEQHRDGDFIRRDIRGRIMMEATPAGRITNYEYEGTSSKPKSFLVADRDGSYIEHGVRAAGKGNNGWTVYREVDGHGLDPKNLKDPAREVRDPNEQVKSVSVNQRTGRRVLHHANGDDTWQPNDDRRVWRKNAGGSQTITGWGDDGRRQINHHVSAEGVKTRYEYDREGQPKYIREYAPDGETHRLQRRGLDWYQDGDKTNIETHRLKDGSVRVNYLDGNRQVTKHPTGETLYESFNQNGRRQVNKTIDTEGVQREFVYNRATGEPIRMTVTNPENGGKEVWTIKSPLLTGADRQEWRSDRGREYNGSISVDKDGSVRFVDNEGGKQWVQSVRGTLLDVTPSPKFVR